jgi:hypothetical protein
MARGSHDLLPLTARRSRLAAGQTFAMLAKRGDPIEHLFEQHLRVAFAVLCGLPNQPPNLASEVRKRDQPVITRSGKTLAHLLSERHELGVYLLPKVSHDALNASAHGRINAKRKATTLPSSHRVDNDFRSRTGRWPHIDVTSTLEVA